MNWMAWHPPPKNRRILLYLFESSPSSAPFHCMSNLPMNDEHNSKLSKQYISSISQYFISENNIPDSSNVTMFGCHGHISLGMSCQCGCDIVVLLSQSWSVAAAFSPVLVYFSCDGEDDREALNRNYFRPPLAANTLLLSSNNTRGFGLPAHTCCKCSQTYCGYQQWRNWKDFHDILKLSMPRNVWFDIMQR